MKLKGNIFLKQNFTFEFDNFFKKDAVIKRIDGAREGNVL